MLHRHARRGGNVGRHRFSSRKLFTYLSLNNREQQQELATESPQAAVQTKLRALPLDVLAGLLAC